MTAITPEIVHLPADTPVDALMTALRRDGAVIIDALCSDAAMAALHAEVAPWIAATPVGRDRFTGTQTTRTGALVVSGEPRNAQRISSILNNYGMTQTAATTAAEAAARLAEAMFALATALA